VTFIALFEVKIAKKIPGKFSYTTQLKVTAFKALLSLLKLVLVAHMV